MHGKKEYGGGTFSVCFNMMKIKYETYDRSIDNSEFVSPDDKINVFINFESILNNLCIIKDIDKKIILERNFSDKIISEILNLVAHYKRFFRGNGLDTRVFVYYNKLSCKEYKNEKYIEDYRSYYQNMYLHNPRFAILGDSLEETIVKDVTTIMEFIPNVYFLTVDGFDSSLVPYIIGKMDESYKNFIITQDIYDTQYQLYKNFMCHYIRRSPNGTGISNSNPDTLKMMFKELDLDESYDIFKNKSFFIMLLMCNGSKYRTIEPIKGYGFKTMTKLLNKAVEDNVITKDISSIELISKLFSEDKAEQILNNFYAFDIENQYKELSKHDIFSIEKQIVDRFDHKSLIQLNNTRFYKYQFDIVALTM